MGAKLPLRFGLNEWPFAALIRAGGGLALRRDSCGRWKLDLHRVPIDHVEKRVRISGVIVADGLIDVDVLEPNQLIH